MSSPYPPSYVPQETGDHAEATLGTRTPWRWLAYGVGCPQPEGGEHRSVSSWPSHIHAERRRSNPGSPKLTMSQEIMTSLASHTLP
jgi:hypothetical protein